MGSLQFVPHIYLLLLCNAGILLSVFSAPSSEGRKYLVKSNAPKKVYHKVIASPVDLQQQPPQPPLMDQSNVVIVNKAADIGSPSDISVGNVLPNGGTNNSGSDRTPWSFLSNSLMQLLRMFFGVPNELVANGLTPATDKMDGPSMGFSWGQVIGYGLKLMIAALSGGPQQSTEFDGVDKIGIEGGPPPSNQGLFKTLLGALVNGEEASGTDVAKQTNELINLTVALMNALKQSFSQRALRARSLGDKDKLSDLSLAAIDMGKAYAKTFNGTSDSCKEKRICEAARECVQDVGQSNAYGICHLSAYVTANLMHYTQGGTKDSMKRLMMASRKGRTLQDCNLAYTSCNEII